MECQVDFGYLGLLGDPVTGQRRKVHALIFTACYSRHMFVWLTFSHTLAALIAGGEAAWEFFGGVFHVLIPDNAYPRCRDVGALAKAAGAAKAAELTELTGVNVSRCLSHHTASLTKLSRPATLPNA
jgi:hypothetical protein